MKKTNGSQNMKSQSHEPHNHDLQSIDRRQFMGLAAAVGVSAMLPFQALPKHVQTISLFGYHCVARWMG